MKEGLKSSDLGEPKDLRRKGGKIEGVIGRFSPTFRSRTRDNAHIFYAHEGAGKREGE